MDLNWMLFSTDGRIGRAQYWLYGVLGSGVSVLLLVLIASFAESDEIGGVIVITGSLLAFWQTVAVQVKRWHDRGKSGWWFFLNFVPVIGGLWVVLELGLLPGQAEENQYGAPYREVQPVLDMA